MVSIVQESLKDPLETRCVFQMINQKIQSSAAIIRSTTFPSAGSFDVSEANFSLQALDGWPLLFALSETRNNVNKGLAGVSVHHRS